MNKVRSLPDAVSVIKSGSLVALGGILTYRRPMALVAELLNHSIVDLTVMGWTLGIETELLLSKSDAVKSIRTGYTGLDLFGLSPAYREAVEKGLVAVVEETESTLGIGLRAALQGVDYMPAKSLLGTDILTVRPDIRVEQSPYSQREYPLIPQLKPDVALIHVPLADEHGNAVIETNFSIDAEIALLADYTIVSADEIVSAGDSRLSERVRIVGKSVDAVVHCPDGAWPTSCYPNYSIDALAIVDYLEAWNIGKEAVREVLSKWIQKVIAC